MPFLARPAMSLYNLRDPSLPKIWLAKSYNRNARRSADHLELMFPMFP